MTAGIIITIALRLIGRLKEPGQAISTSEGTESLTMLNSMLDSWTTERLNVFSISGPNAYNLVTGTSAYSIGIGATLNAPRPLKIESAGILVPNQGSTGSQRFPLRLITAAEFADIDEKTALSDIPDRLYYNPTVPSGSLNLWPVPTFTTVAEQIELYTWLALAQFADLVTDVVFPPGYQRALTYNLAMDMLSLYPGAVLSDKAIQVAAYSKEAIRALNNSLPGMEPESMEEANARAQRARA